MPTGSTGRTSDCNRQCIAMDCDRFIYIYASSNNSSVDHRSPCRCSDYIRYPSSISYHTRHAKSILASHPGDSNVHTIFAHIQYLFASRSHLYVLIDQRAQIKQKVVDFDQHLVAMRWFLKQTGTTESVLSPSLDQLPGTVCQFKFEERTL